MTVVDQPVEQPMDDALEAVGELSNEVFKDLDIESWRSPAHSNEAVSDEHDRRLWRILADTGLLAAVLPETVGGGGTGVPGMVRLLTDAGAALARLPLVETFVAALVVDEKNLPEVLSGELVITAGLTEHPSTLAAPLRRPAGGSTGSRSWCPTRSAPTWCSCRLCARTARKSWRWPPCRRHASATR